MELDAAVLEAVAVVLLQNCTPRLVVREAEASREARVHQLERRLAERGGWDEV